jgi:hypothetical protein
VDTAAAVAAVDTAAAVAADTVTVTAAATRTVAPVRTIAESLAENSSNGPEGNFRAVFFLFPYWFRGGNGIDDITPSCEGGRRGGLHFSGTGRLRAWHVLQGSLERESLGSTIHLRKDFIRYTREALYMFFAPSSENQGKGRGHIRDL